MTVADRNIQQENSVIAKPHSWLNISVIIVLSLSAVFLLYVLISFVNNTERNFIEGVIVLSLVITLSIGSYFIYRDVFAPLFIFSSTWLFALSVSCLKLSGLQQEWSSTTWITIIGSSLAIIIGILFASVFIKSSKKSTLENESIDIKWSKKRFLIAITIIFISGICFYTLQVLIAGEIPILAESKTGAYQNFSMEFLQTITAHLTFIPVLVYIYLTVFKSEPISKTLKYYLYVIATVATLAMISILSKQYIFMCLFFPVFAINYLKEKKIRLRTIIILSLICLLFFVYISECRFSTEKLAEIGKMRVSSQFMFITMPYLYVALGFENLNQLINQEEQLRFTAGENTLRPFWTLTGLKFIFKSVLYPPKSKDYLLTESLNVSTFLKSIYVDFGLIGSLVFPFIYGFIANLAYLWHKKRNNQLSLLLLGLSTYCFLFLFFTNFYAVPTNFIFLITVLLLDRFCRIKPAQHNVPMGAGV